VGALVALVSWTGTGAVTDPAFAKVNVIGTVMPPDSDFVSPVSTRTLSLLLMPKDVGRPAGSATAVKPPAEDEPVAEGDAEDDAEDDDEDEADDDVVEDEDEDEDAEEDDVVEDEDEDAFEPSAEAAALAESKTVTLPAADVVMLVSWSAC
jgi:hypothetical protein